MITMGTLLFYFTVLGVYFYLPYITASSGPQLIHVQVFLRHGARAPSLAVSYPTNKNNISSYPDGPSQLTKVGKEQAFQLGKFLRSRYSNFLPIRFNIDNIYVRSSDVERCLQTAECVLTGLYYPLDAVNRWSNIINWNPVPIHTIAPKTDYLLRSWSNCPKLSRLYEESLVSPEVKKYQESIQKDLDYLSEKTGRKIDLVGCSDLCDVWNCEKAQGLNWSSWVTDEIFSKVCKVSDYLFGLEVATNEQQVMYGGVFIDKLKNNVNRIINGSYSEIGKYMTIYSGHDTTIVGALSALGVFNGKGPTYCASIIFELYRKTPDSNSYFIRTFYRVNDDLQQLVLPACGETDCPLEKFLSLANSNALSETNYVNNCK